MIFQTLGDLIVIIVQKHCIPQMYGYTVTCLYISIAVLVKSKISLALNALRIVLWLNGSHQLTNLALLTVECL